MTLDEIQARRDEVWDVVRKHGVDRLTVVVAEPGRPVPYGDAYFEVGFTPEGRARARGVRYGSVIMNMINELSELLDCPVWVGDLDGTSRSPRFTERLRQRATVL